MVPPMGFQFGTSFLKLLLCFAFLSFIKASPSGPLKRLIRQNYEKNGEPELFNCEIDEKNARRRPVPLNFELTISPKWSNKNEFIKDQKVISRYYWSYRMTREIGKVEESVDIDKYRNRQRMALTFPPYLLDPGFYRIYPNVTLKNPADRLKLFKIKACYLSINGLDPIPIISGGTYRLVPSGTSIKLDASESTDPNKPSAAGTVLKYEWKCSQKLGTFCMKDVISPKSSFVIPAKYMINGEKFDVVLKVTTRFNTSAKAHQEIDVIQDGILLQIKCQKNCPPISAPNMNIITFLLVACLKNCNDVKEEDYMWSIKTKSGKKDFLDYEKDTQFGNKGEKFVIEKNVLKPDEYSVSVNITDSKNRRGETAMTLIFDKPPKVDKCETRPSGGESVRTFFTLECKLEITFRPHLYEFYFTENKNTHPIISGSYPDIEKMLFLLPSSTGRTFTVKISIGTGPYTLVPVLTKVRPSLSNKPIEEALKSFKEIYFGKTPHDSLSAMISSTDPEKRDLGLETFRALVNELVDVKSNNKNFQEFLETMKYQASEDLLKLPLESIEQIVIIGDVITELLLHNEVDESDPLLAKISSTLCKKMSQGYVEMMKREEVPVTLTDISSKAASILSKCLGANTNPNFDILEPLLINITTAAPTVLEPVIIEEYPDYKDFSDGYYKNIEDLQEVINNIFEGNAALAKATALTTTIGEKPVVLKSARGEIMVTKDKGNALAKMSLKSNGVILEPSQSFRTSDHPLDILMTTWTTDLLWWNVNKTKVATDILKVEFWHSTCRERIKHFDKPVQLYFQVNRQNLESEIVEDMMIVPGNYRNLLHGQLNPYIYVRRVTLPRHTTLLVEFHDLSADFDAVISNFKYPTIEDFAPPKRISLGTNKTSLAFANKCNFDVWAYVGILPSKKEISNVFQFQFSFSITCCIRWRPVKNQWETVCKPEHEGNNLTTIHCECKNFSTIAGYIQNVQSIPQIVLDPEIFIELQKTFTIFITLALIFLLYNLLLLFTFFKRKKKAMVYFLADNVPKHRFAYLVMITTGKTRTTSHITIRINGRIHSTPVHVLNYPDPKLRLLQKECKDVFVLTNEKYLGEVTSLELWFDCVGVRPSWHCEEIQVYDLQLKKSWYFGVQLLFSAQKTNVTLKPGERETQRRVFSSLKRVTIWNGFHTWCFWAHEENFSFVKRLTVVLSTMLLMFMIVLMMLKEPEMELRDSFDLERYVFLECDVLIAFVSSLVSFSIHIALAWIFRLSSVRISDFQQENRLSYKVTKFCWMVLIMMIMLSTTFLTARGFWVPFNKSLVWLTACCIGFMLDFFIYENIFIMFISFFQTYEKIEYFGEQFEMVASIIRKQRRFLLQNFGDSLLLPYVKHLHKPLEKKQIKERKMKEEIRHNFTEELTDLIMFSVYTIILYVVILINRDSLTVLNKNGIEYMFEGKHTRTLPFSSVQTVEQMYRYINETLIPVMQPMYWYEGYTISEPGAMVDSVNKYLGVARFRQHRIKTDLCKVLEQIRFLNMSKCLPEYASSYGETKHFGYGWSNFSSILVLDRLRSIWKFSDEFQTETLSFTGQFASYSGGGYVAYLGRNLRNSIVNFRKMLDKFWIDQQTRGFFIEFLTYNSNNNMFNAVRLLFEQSATGYITQTVEIYSARMIFVRNEMQRMSLIFFGLFVVWVFVLLIKRLHNLFKNFRLHYKNFWMFVDFTIIILSFSCIVVYIIRFKMVSSYLDSLERVKHNEFISYFKLFYMEDFITICAAFLVLIATARLWKFFRFGLFFRIMERTLSSASFPLLGITFAFFNVLIGFGLSGVLLFGNEFPELSSLMKIVATLIILSLKPDQMDITNFIRSKIDYWYFALYLILMQIVLFIYVTIILMSYVKAQLDCSEESLPYNLRDFVQEQVQYIPKYLQQKYERMRGGEGIKLVKPKGDEFRYANCVSTQKSTLKSMECMLKCIIRNMKQSQIEENLSERDVKLMLEVCQNVALQIHDEDEAEIFFKGHFAGEKIRIIDEMRIMRMEEVVEMLLQPRVKEEREDLTKMKKENLRDECVKIIHRNRETLKRCDLQLRLICCKIEDVDFICLE